MAIFVPLAFLLLLLSIAGWGYLAIRLTGFNHRLTQFLRCLSLETGLAVLCWTLGWLNYFQLFTPTRAILLVALGAFATAYSWGRIRQQWPVILLAAALLSFWIYLPPALNGDDTYGYAAFINKIHDLGGIGPEPFSGRRHYTWGVQYPIQAVIVSMLDKRYLSICEPALGMALTMIVLMTLSTGAPRKTMAILLVGLSGLLGSYILLNLTPAFLMVAPLLLLIYAAINPQDNWLLSRPVEYGAGLGILVVLLTGMRPTATLPAGILFMMAFAPQTAVRLTEWIRGFLKGSGAAGVVATLFALPFSLDLHRSSGTYLYPFLGRGFQTHSSTGVLGVQQFADDLTKLITIPASDGLLLAAIIGFALWLSLTAAGWEVKLRMAAVLGTAVLTEVLLVYGSPEESVRRYAAPMNLALLLYLAVQFDLPMARPLIARFRRPWVIAGIGVVAVSLALMSSSAPVQRLIEGKLEKRLTVLWPSAEEIDDYNNLQSAAPDGATILAGLRRNDLLNFRRNHVFINDPPSYLGPPPGWPWGKDVKELADYFRDCQVQYVAVMTSDDSRIAQVMKIASEEADTQSRHLFSIVYRSRRLLLYRLLPNKTSALTVPENH